MGAPPAPFHLGVKGGSPWWKAISNPRLLLKKSPAMAAMSRQKLRLRPILVTGQDTWLGLPRFGCWLVIGVRFPFLERPPAVELRAVSRRALRRRAEACSISGIAQIPTSVKPL